MPVSLSGVILGATNRPNGATWKRPIPGPGAGDDLSDALRAIAGESLGTAPVSLVRAGGAISMAGGGGVLSEGGIVEGRMMRTLTRLERDDDVID